MSTGRVAIASHPRHRDRWVPGKLPEASREERVEADQERARKKQRAIVWTRIAIRPGDNSDILEALGLIPTVVKA